MSVTQKYGLGRFPVKGGTLCDAEVHYRTWGLSSKPCVVIWTSFLNCKLNDIQYLVDMVDSSKYYIVAFALFGNGESSSPCSTARPHNGAFFPEINFPDNAAAHFKVLGSLGVSQVACAIGYSMASYLAYYWAVECAKDGSKVPPLQNFICISGSACASYSTQHMILGSRASLSSSEDFQSGRYPSGSQPEIGMRAFGRVFSSWSYSPQWYKPANIKATNISASPPTYRNLDDFIVGHWEDKFLKGWDANNILSHLQMWRSADDLTEKLSSIKARALIIYCDTDMIVPPQDSQNQKLAIPNGEEGKIRSDWGHMAGAGVNKEATQTIKSMVEAFLAVHIPSTSESYARLRPPHQ